MDIKRLLIADKLPIFAEELARRLCGTFQVRFCHDGPSAVHLLETFQPHVLVLDMMLPGIDCSGIAHIIQTCPTQPAILATVNQITPFVEHFAQQVKIDYFMSKPCEFGSLTNRICEIAGNPPKDRFLTEGLDSTISNMIATLNVSFNHKGFDYLCYGIDRFSRDPGISMTRDLYPDIARQFHVRPEAVEHDIRRAIDAAWRSANPNTWRLYFPAGMGDTIPRPTNTAFISTLARRLRLCQVRRA